MGMILELRSFKRQVCWVAHACIQDEAQQPHCMEERDSKPLQLRVINIKRAQHCIQSMR